ncbi:hypothetical protein [Streptomyces sp. NPDC001274]
MTAHATHLFWLVKGHVGCAARNSIYFWPIYTGASIPDGSWRDRMWLDTWI